MKVACDFPVLSRLFLGEKEYIHLTQGSSTNCPMVKCEVSEGSISFHVCCEDQKEWNECNEEREPKKDAEITDSIFLFILLLL